MVQHKILFVDDEVNALSSFKRLFFVDNDIDVYTAKNGPEALKILNYNEIDLVVSDMRMPQLNGNDFLQYLKDKYPNILRIMLTAYADVSTTVDAINKSEVFRFLTKPWNDEELKKTILGALEYTDLKRRNEELSKVIWGKNRELNALNKSLEQNVRQRTEQLEQANNHLKLMNEVLKQNFDEVIHLLSGAISLIHRDLAAHSNRVAQLCRALCDELGLDEDHTKMVSQAAFLHDIGLLGASDHIFAVELEQLDETSKSFYLYHPVIGEKLVGSVKALKRISKLIRSHHEEYNGTGFPDKLRGAHIPLGSQIIKIVSDYDNFLFKNGFSSEESLNRIKSRSYKSYDTDLINSFIKTISETNVHQHYPARRIMVKDLQAGMYLLDEVTLENGVLLIPKGVTIDESIKAKLDTFSSLLKLDRKVEIKYPDE
ncbi:MAG: response regulator [Spirochaetes bacterium]|nr:response regulator [Spirochaetota bacterium]